MSVIVTSDNYVEGYDVIEVGSEIHDVFMNTNIPPHDTFNRFLSAITHEQERITQKVVDKAVQRVQSIAMQNGWNAVLNFDIEYEELGEWGGFHGVNVHVYGVLCYIEPSEY